MANSQQPTEMHSEPPRAAGSRIRFLARHAGRGALIGGICVALLAAHRGEREDARIVHLGSAVTKVSKKGNDIRWHTSKAEVLLDSSIDSLGPAARDAVEGAFKTWMGADPKLPRVNFRRVESAKFEPKPDGKNTVFVAPIKIPGHEHDLAITLTYSDQQSGEIVEADMVINSEYPFRVLDDGQGEDNGNHGEDNEQSGEVADNNGNETKTVISSARASCTAGAQQKTCMGGSYDIQNVVTHEVGHFYGLGEDNEDTAATMYFCTNRCETHKRVLTEDDRQVMSELYVAADPGDSEAAADEAVGCGGARFTPKGDAKHAVWTFLAPLVGLVLHRARRRSA